MTKTKTPFAIHDEVVSIRDLEMDNIGIVEGYAADGKILVKFPHQICAMALPVQSVQLAAEGAPLGRWQSKNLAEAENFADYINRIESGISKEHHNEKNSTR